MVWLNSGLPGNLGIWRLAVLEVALCWVLFFSVILVNHIRVNRRRNRSGGDAQPSLRAPASMCGLLVESLSFALLWVFRQPHPELISAISILAAMLVAAFSTACLALSLRHLGQQWRIKAVVTADHRLVTTGPYRFVRHPVLASLLGMLAASAILLARWEAAVAAVAVYIAGTEIRVRAEDGLLARRFSADFPAYRARVRAYIPFVR